MREVRCLSDDMLSSEGCKEELKPVEREECNPEPCIPHIGQLLLYSKHGSVAKAPTLECHTVGLVNDGWSGPNYCQTVLMRVRGDFSLKWFNIYEDLIPYRKHVKILKDF